MQTKTMADFVSLYTRKGCLHPNTEVFACLVGIVLLFDTLIISIYIAFNYLRNPTSDIFFKHKQQVCACKPRLV